MQQENNDASNRRQETSSTSLVTLDDVVKAIGGISAVVAMFVPIFIRRNKKFQEAKRLVGEARNILGGEPHAPFIGDITCTDAEFNHARELALEAESLLPRNPHVLHIVGVIRMAEGRLDVAEKTLRRALKKKPKSSSILNTLSHCLMQQGDFSRAISVMAQAFSIEPNNIDLKTNWAFSLYSVGRLNEAKSVAREVLAADSECDKALNILHLSQHDLGEYTDSIATCTRMLELDPHDLHARVGLARSYHASKDLLKARTEYERAIPQLPDYMSANVHFAYSNLMHSLNEFEIARDAAQVCVSRCPNESDYHLALARALEALGDAESASRSLTVCLEIRALEHETLPRRFVMSPIRDTISTRQKAARARRRSLS